MIAILLIWLNMYLLTYPPKIIGEIIDLLYDINQNKEVIFKSILSLLGICILMLFVRTGWKYYVCYANRGMEKELKNQLFDRFLKIKLSKLQNIKNGQLMAYFVKDINEIRAFFFRLLSFGTRIIATCVIAIYTMATGVDVKLTLITLIPILVTSCLIIKIKQYVEESYKRAQNTFTEMSEYVQESTDSIHTVIGERGVDLSGGQKQRVVISRAFLQKSNIIIFDDTFSALDNRTEQSLLKNIKELTNNKTCIIISNRISDIKESDHIIVMESGKIVEEGNNDSLMEKQGLYYQFYKQQAKQEINQILD